MDLRTIGVFAFLDGLSGAQTGPFARSTVEKFGIALCGLPKGSVASAFRWQPTC